MASIRHRVETGTLFLDFRLGSRRIREQTNLPDTPENRSLLERKLAAIQAEIRSSTFDYTHHFPRSRLAARLLSSLAPPSTLPGVSPAFPGALPGALTVTFGEFAETWMAEMRPMWRISTRQLHDSLLNRYLLPAFAHLPLGAIGRADLMRFRAELITTVRGRRKLPLSPASVNHVLKLLRAILAEAAQRYQFQNPAEQLKRVKNPRKDIEPFSLTEVDLILKHCRADYRNYLVVRFFTGMRSGEIHGLKWARVDFDRRQILVRETYGHGRVEYTKTDGSQREIDMSGLVFDALRAQHRATGDRDYVFCNTRGAPVDEKSMTRWVWYPLLRLLNLKPRRPYQSRHTSATLWLAAGESPEWIARQLGHTTTEMLFRVYSRYVPNLTRRDGAAFDALIADALSGKTGARP